MYSNWSFRFIFQHFGTFKFTSPSSKFPLSWLRRRGIKLSNEEENSCVKNLIKNFNTKIWEYIFFQFSRIFFRWSLDQNFKFFNTFLTAQNFAIWYILQFLHQNLIWCSFSPPHKYTCRIFGFARIRKVGCTKHHLFRFWFPDFSERMC